MAAGIFRKAAWRLLPVMGLMYVVNYLDRTNIAFAALTMNRELGFSPEVFGFGTMSLVLSMVLIGGINSVLGPVIAALALTFASEAMAGIGGFEDARYIVIAVAMILVLRLAPGGLIQILERLAPTGQKPATPTRSPA